MCQVWQQLYGRLYSRVYSLFCNRFQRKCYIRFSVGFTLGFIIGVWSQVLYSGFRIRFYDKFIVLWIVGFLYYVVLISRSFLVGGFK